MSRAVVGTIRQSRHKNQMSRTVDRLFQVASGEGRYAYFTKDCWKVRLSRELDMTQLNSGTLAGIVVQKGQGDLVWLRVKGPVPNGRI